MQNNISTFRQSVNDNQSASNNLYAQHPYEALDTESDMSNSLIVTSQEQPQSSGKDKSNLSHLLESSKRGTDNSSSSAKSIEDPSKAERNFSFRKSKFDDTTDTNESASETGDNVDTSSVHTSYSSFLKRKSSQKKRPFLDRVLARNSSTSDIENNTNNLASLHISTDSSENHTPSIASSHIRRSKFGLSQSFSSRGFASRFHGHGSASYCEDDYSSSPISTSINSETSSINSDAAMFADIGAGLKSRRLRHLDEYLDSDIISLRDRLKEKLVTRLKDRYCHINGIKKITKSKIGSGATAKVKVMTMKPEMQKSDQCKGSDEDEVESNSSFSTKNPYLFAVKVYRKKTKNETEVEFLEKLATEWCIHSKLVHPNVVTVYELCLDHHTITQDLWCSVMEFCDGGDLLSLMMTHKHFGMVEKICTFKQVVRGVAYVHSQGIAHRDIKPENIILSKSGIVKITDFGTSDICCPFCDDPKAVHENHKYYRPCRGKCGSTPYMAPELLAITTSDQTYDGFAVDFWALGVLLFAILTGGAPWRSAQKEDRLFNYYCNCLEKHKKKMCSANDEETQSSSSINSSDDEPEAYESINSFVSFVTADFTKDSTSDCDSIKESLSDQHLGNAGGAPLKLPIEHRLPSCKLFNTRITHTGQLRLLYGFLSLSPSTRLSATEALQDSWFKIAECCQTDLNETIKQQPLFDVASGKPIPRRMTVKSKHKHVPDD